MRILERRKPATVARRQWRSPTRRASLPPSLLDALDGSPSLRLAAGEVLFREGALPDRVYFVSEGSLRITKGAVELATIGAGDVVGELGILHRVPRTATVTALEPSELLAVDGELFRRAVAEEDVTARELGDLAQRRHAGALLAARLSTAGAGVTVGAGRFETLEAQPGAVIVRQGDQAAHFFVLVSGDVDVAIERSAGPSVQFGRLHAPDCFGEIALLTNTPRTATVRVAETGARMFKLDRAAFDALLSDPAAGAALRLIANQRLANKGRPRA
jgi:CRP-like cAMP-binding protein